MTTADWALVVSILSLDISIGGFIWNIWSKFIYPKPRIRVAFYVAEMIPDPSNYGSFLSLSGTNHGPIECTLTSAVLRLHWRRGRSGWGLPNPLDGFPYQTNVTQGPFTGFPKKLAVGESFTVYFAYTRDGFLAEHIRRIGFRDTFGRHHWAPRASVKKVNLAYEERFGPIAPDFRSKERDNASGEADQDAEAERR